MGTDKEARLPVNRWSWNTTTRMRVESETTIIGGGCPKTGALARTVWRGGTSSCTFLTIQQYKGWYFETDSDATLCNQDVVKLNRKRYSPWLSISKLSIDFFFKENPKILKLWLIQQHQKTHPKEEWKYSLLEANKLGRCCTYFGKYFKNNNASMTTERLLLPLFTDFIFLLCEGGQKP